MTRRPTVLDVAREAGVGVATVDRVLNRRAAVRIETAARVLAAAQALGYHAAPALRRRLDEAAEPVRLGFLLQKKSDPFYQALGGALAAAAKGIGAKARIEYLDEIAPSIVAERFLDLAGRCDAVALVAADHPRLSDAVAQAAGRGPVFALLSDLAAPARSGFIGTDHRKAGRTAAWAIARLSKRAGPVAIVVGSHRYLGHELSEISFRAFFRERAPEFRLLEPLVSLEDSRLAYENTLDLLKREPDLAGLYVAGGGMQGVIAALRDHGGYADIVAVCNEIFPQTRDALIDGVIDLVLATPAVSVAREAVAAMVASLRERPAGGSVQVMLPVELFVAENV